MQIGPHENLAVLSIQHDIYGPGRLARIGPGQLRVVEVVREIPVVQVKVVTQTQPTPPADCPPCDRGGFPGFIADSQPVASSDESHPAPSPVSDAGGLTFSHGQAVPSTGNLLDIMA
jgi:hypothetical protein